MLIESLNPSNHPDYANHEKVIRGYDEQSGLEAIIAIHNRNLGPALGGCRMFPYASTEEALTDVLRLSKGMTYKSALAGLPLGGGKAVIIGNSKQDKTPELMSAMGRFIDSLSGSYIGAEDSGINVSDVKQMGRSTSHVAGLVERRLENGDLADGDPSPSTAYGVFQGIKASLKHRFNTDSLDNVRVAVQGIGNVGRNLVELLVANGATVHVADAYQPTIDTLLDSDLGDQVQYVAIDKIHSLDVDVFSPCALGGSLNTQTLVELQAPIVAGAANNQLINDGAGQYLFHKGTLYAPDFVINAGGIIDIFYERDGYDHKKARTHIEQIGSTLTEIFEYSAAEQLPTHITAEKIGEARFLGTKVENVA